MRTSTVMRLLHQGTAVTLVGTFILLVATELNIGRGGSVAPGSALAAGGPGVGAGDKEILMRLEQKVAHLEQELIEEKKRHAETEKDRKRSEKAGQNKQRDSLYSRTDQTLGNGRYPEVKFLNYEDRKRILVTGGAGFVGSHLVDRLMMEGHEVTAADNFYTGRKRNVEHWIGHENFEMINHDVVNPLFLEVDQIYHLASPASPPHYMHNPVKTIKTNTVGTVNMLGLAKRVGAKVLIASTSEVYGDPEVHPQKETYWGHVNPIGPRACYDEGKRVAETLAYAYMRQSRVPVRVARIFNTYGPRMHMADGRVVSNFILQALKNEPITVYGDGSQTRSFQYVTDLVDGLIKLMNSNYTQPVNLGNPEEHRIEEFANIIRDKVGSPHTLASDIVHKPPMEDDPQRRRPDISLAKRVLNWRPRVSLQKGLEKTIDYFSKELQRKEHGNRNIPHPKEYWVDEEDEDNKEDAKRSKLKRDKPLKKGP